MSLDKTRRRLLPIFRVCFFVVGGLLLAGVLFLISVTHLDGPHSRQHAHEAVAVGKLHTVIELQSKYAAAHADKGFACELPLLKPIEQRADADYDPVGFLATGTWSGYRFAATRRFRWVHRLTQCPVGQLTIYESHRGSPSSGTQGISGMDWRRVRPRSVRCR